MYGIDLLKHGKISRKLPALMLAAVAVAVTVSGLIAYLEERRGLIAQGLAIVDTVAEQRRDRLEESFRRNAEDLDFLARSQMTNSALIAFSTEWRRLGKNPGAHLQKFYIDKNPNPVGEKENLNFAPDGSLYSANHMKYHPSLRTFLRNRGYYDIFMFDPSGNLVYTVFKERDFATNMIDGEWKDTGLARVFRNAVELEEGEIAFEDYAPYAPSNDAPASFIAQPMFDSLSHKLLGVVAIQLPSDYVSKVTTIAAGLGETGESFAVGPDFLSRSNSRLSDEALVLKKEINLPQVKSALKGESGKFTGSGTSGNEVQTAFRPVKVFDTTWALIVERDSAELDFALSALKTKLLAASALTLAIISLAAYLFSRSLSLPLVRVADAMARVTGGDLETTIPSQDRGDEIGQIASALEDQRARLSEARLIEAQAKAAAETVEKRAHAQKIVVDALNRGLRAVAEGDLTALITEELDEEYETLRQNFNHSLEQMQRAMDTVAENSISIRDGSEQISQSSDDLSRRTESQAATLEETVAALEQLTASVNSTATGAQEVAGIVRSARSDAEKSGEVVQAAVKAMTEIEQSSNQVNQIISVIEDIAFQTNLLALNAGVEAARAGEAGKGFAVVATEVRALAQRSSESAIEIKTLIGNSAEHVDRGVELVGRAGEALVSIVGQVADISEHIDGIAVSAEEQSSGLGEINSGMNQLDAVTQQNAAMVEQATAAVHSLKTEAQELSDLVAQFRTDVPQPDVDVVTPQVETFNTAA